MARTKTEAHRPEIERALRFIGDHLEQPIAIADVARAAGRSEFHLHRVFHATTGESIGRFITRRRLELAALRLAYEGDRSVTDIALSSGYSSSSNFTKAFTAYFGCSPTRVRDPAPGGPAGTGLPAPISKLTALHGQAFRPEALYALPLGVDPVERRRQVERWNAVVRFDQIEERPLVCLAGPGGYGLTDLEATWEQLIAWARQLGLARDDIDAWGRAHDSPVVTAPELCRYDACVPCPPDTLVAAPLFRDTMPAGRYAVFRHRGPAADLGDAYRTVYSCWFPASSVAPEDFAPFDHYVGDFPEDGVVDLEMWFRIRPRR